MSSPPLVGESRFAKLKSEKTGRLVDVVGVEPGGVWVRSQNLAAALASKCNPPALHPESLAIFVPFEQLEWLLASPPRS